MRNMIKVPLWTGHHAFKLLRRGTNQGAAMAWVDLVAGVAAQVDLHPNPLLLLQSSYLSVRAFSFDRGLKKVGLKSIM